PAAPARLRLGVNVAELIAAFDQKVDKAVDGLRSPAMDGVVYRLSSAADHGLLWQAFGVARALRHGRDLGAAARFAAAMGIESALTNGPVKALFNRVRAFDYEGGPRGPSIRSELRLPLPVRPQRPRVRGRRPGGRTGLGRHLRAVLTRPSPRGRRRAGRVGTRSLGVGNGRERAALGHRGA